MSIRLCRLFFILIFVHYTTYSDMNKPNRFHIASSLVLLAFLLSTHCAYAQVPKLFVKFTEKQNKVKSGYVKLQETYINDNDTMKRQIEESFFISTPKNTKYLTFQQSDIASRYNCKSTHTEVSIYSRKDSVYIEYEKDEFDNAQYDNYFSFAYPIKVISTNKENNYTYKRIPPKISKKNIRYKVMFPDDDISSDISIEWEFDKKTLNWVQQELSATHLKAERMGNRIDVFEQRLYDYIHPDILDTISFTFENIKKGYDLQCVAEQAKRQLIFQDTIIQSITENNSILIEDVSQKVISDTLFMPSWKFPLLSGDSIYSDSINSRFLLIDMWFVNCQPCRKVMRELTFIDTLYGESLLKMISINALDKDIAKISQVTRELNLKNDVACAFNSYSILYNMTKKMSGGECQGYPQIYLIDMKTKEVIWYSCGWYDGFTKDIEEIIKG